MRSKINGRIRLIGSLVVAGLAMSVVAARAGVIIAYHTDGTSQTTVQNNTASVAETGLTAGSASSTGNDQAWRNSGWDLPTSFTGLSGRNDIWHMWRSTGSGDPVSTANYEKFSFGYSGATLAFDTFIFDFVANGPNGGSFVAKYAVFASVNSGNFQTLGSGSMTVPAGSWYNGLNSPITMDITSLGDLNSGDTVEFRLAVSGSPGADSGIFTQGMKVSAVIPEPSSGLVFLAGAAGLGLLRRKMRS